MVLESLSATGQPRAVVPTCLETVQVGLLSELPFAGDDILISYMSNVKQEVARLLNKLPDDCSIEDVQYHLYVVEKVRLGFEDADANGTLSQEEVEARLSKWLPK